MFFSMNAAEFGKDLLADWSTEISDLMRSYGAGNRRMAIDRIEPVGCAESLIAEAGSESVRLETQLLVTENGIERLDSFPYEGY